MGGPAVSRFEKPLARKEKNEPNNADAKEEAEKDEEAARLLL